MERSHALLLCHETCHRPVHLSIIRSYRFIMEVPRVGVGMEEWEKCGMWFMDMLTIGVC